MYPQHCQRLCGTERKQRPAGLSENVYHANQEGFTNNGMNHYGCLSLLGYIGTHIIPARTNREGTGRPLPTGSMLLHWRTRCRKNRPAPYRGEHKYLFAHTHYGHWTMHSMLLRTLCYQPCMFATLRFERCGKYHKCPQSDTDSTHSTSTAVLWRSLIGSVIYFTANILQQTHVVVHTMCVKKGALHR